MITQLRKDKAAPNRRCRACGCTDEDCRQCIKAQGHPCYWVEATLCSRCQRERHGTTTTYTRGRKQ